MKQKFGTRLTSLLLCLALVAGLLQGLPVAAKAANNHNSIGLGATWFWGETINLGSGVHFWYKEDISIEKAYETESQNRDSEVLQPDLLSLRRRRPRPRSRRRRRPQSRPRSRRRRRP